MNYTINIPDSIAVKLINRLCLRFGYQDSVVNPDFNPDEDQSETNPLEIPNPESKPQFAKRMNVMWLKKMYEQGAIKERLAEIKDDLIDL